MSKYVGETQNNLKKYFDYALNNSPSILFIDEIDAIGISRKENSESHQLCCLSELLQQLTKIKIINCNKKVYIIGCTNKPDLLDKAILRRFEKIISINLPNKNTRISLIKLFMRNEKLIELNDKDYDKISILMDGFSGSLIKDICKTVCHERIDNYINQITNKNQLNPQLKPITYTDFETCIKNPL